MDIIARDELTKLVLAVYIPEEQRRRSHRGTETAWLNIFRAPAMKMVSLKEQMKARSTRIA